LVEIAVFVGSQSSNNEGKCFRDHIEISSPLATLLQWVNGGLRAMHRAQITMNAFRGVPRLKRAQQEPPKS
jgi:hypothetical protein